ncbi:unnamed protein product [Rotaria sp. Silwood2]|nr:unnamed protein product [Rotaria sp. Silwood2]CAF4026194.1 unnamed protein product [Rotaria sp. Silwood2]CAF4240056.1 unnamed protein product [Rotaria sp. Silwood2]
MHIELEYPSLDEYNFHQETILKNLNIFGNEHVRSRLIVLSCGAGKSLVGVTAASKINKSLIFCNSNVQLFTSSDEDKLNDSYGEWSVMLLDEVHTKLCLTAKLVRENDRIADINCLIGFKLYEANQTELQNLSHITKVQCSEVCCRVTSKVFQEYVLIKNNQHRRLISCTYAHFA